MRRRIQFLFLVSCLVFPSMGAAAEWQAVEKIKTYAITGKSGPELYQSIGARGPQASGGVRAIAHTSFVLTWQRKYEPQEDACVLVSAKPKLTITYTLPKPQKVLHGLLEARWQTFIAGVEAHERVHGEMIKDMVRRIEATSVGLTVAGDPQCRKIRTELTARLAALSRAQRETSRSFDRTELSNGGNIHQLILALVNGS